MSKPLEQFSVDDMVKAMKEMNAAMTKFAPYAQGYAKKPLPPKITVDAYGIRRKDGEVLPPRTSLEWLDYEIADVRRRAYA